MYNLSFIFILIMKVENCKIMLSQFTVMSVIKLLLPNQITIFSWKSFHFYLDTKLVITKTLQNRHYQIVVTTLSVMLNLTFDGGFTDLSFDGGGGLKVPPPFFYF